MFGNAILAGLVVGSVTRMIGEASCACHALMVTKESGVIDVLQAMRATRPFPGNTAGHVSIHQL